jgi:hypothetical protein
VAGVGVIASNINRFGSLSGREFREALAWGSDPLIVITNLANMGTCGADGLFDPRSPGVVQLSGDRVRDFEQYPFGAGADLNARGQKVIIVGAVLLHELCHWGNFRHGIAEKTEAGRAFSAATYGRIVPFFSRVSEVIITP